MRRSSQLRTLLKLVVVNRTCIQTYHVEAAILIKHKVLITNLQGNVQQLQGRIDNQILRVKGFLLHFDVFFDVLLNQPIAAWNLFALYITKKAKCC